MQLPSPPIIRHRISSVLQLFKIAVIPVFMAVATTLTATPKTDSLETILQKEGISPSERLETLSALGYAYWTIDPAKSVYYGREGLWLATDLGDREKQAFNYRVIGVAFWAIGDYQPALDHMLKSLQIYQETENEIGIGNMLLNIGLVYSEQLSYSIAKDYYRRALELYERTGEQGRKATTLTKLASVLTEEDSLYLATSYLDKSIDIHRRNQFRYGLAEAYNRYGVLYCKKKDYNASLDYLYRSRDLSESIADREGIAKCLNDIGATFLAAGKHDDATMYFTQALQASWDVGSKKWRLMAYQGLADAARAQNDLSAAIFFLEQHRSLRDTLLNEKKILAIADLQKKFENREQKRNLELSELRLQNLQEESRRRKITFWSVVMLFVLIVVILTLGIRNQRLRRKTAERDKEREMESMRVEEERREMEMEKIRVRERELKIELELKQKELTSYALNFVKKNEFILDLKKDLASAKSDPAVLAVRKKLQLSAHADRDWENFRLQFENIHEGFLEKIKTLHPDLSQTELRHCSLIRMNMNTKECASVLGISPESAKTSRYRLRRKMNLDEKANLYDYLTSIN